MKFELSYQQTPRERFRSTMNNDIADLLDAYPGIRVLGTSGGCMMTADQDAMVADNSFVVEGNNATVRSLAGAIERQIDRPVSIEVR